MDLLSSGRGLRRWAVASLAANVVIVWTGALVRLTTSGLGCPTWPECSPGSYVPVPASGVHGVIEFGNRLLTFVLVALAVGLILAARRAVRAGTAPARLRPLTLGVGAGIVVQAVIGGVSVLLQLNPWVVGLHLVASVALIGLSVEIVHVVFTVTPIPVGGRLRVVVRAMFWLGLLVVALGVVVTGAGPNAGDGAATRNGLPLEWTAKVHAAAVWLEVGLTALAAWWGRRDRRLRRGVASLGGCEVYQAVVGYVQYFTHLPTGAVLAHLVGATLFVAALTHLFRVAGQANSSGSRAAATAISAR